MTTSPENSVKKKDTLLTRGVVGTLELPSIGPDALESFFRGGGKRKARTKDWRDVLNKNIHLLEIIVFEQQMMTLMLSIIQRPLSDTEHEAFEIHGWYGQLLRRTKDIAYVKLLNLFPKSERPNFSQRVKDYAETFASEINLSPSHIAECINKMRQEPP